MKCLLCNKETTEVITTKLRNGENRNVYYCKECELGILDKTQSDTDLKKFYKKDYRKKFKPKIDKISTPDELFNIYSPFQENRIKLIQEHLTKNMRLLEIGCSAGMFLYHIKKYVKEVVGIDFDSESSRFAAKKCSCIVFDVDIKETELEKKSFDIICMFQVLEHIKNPYNFLNDIKHYLKPNGLIYIEVPNLHDALVYTYNLANHYKFYFHSAHLWYFTEKSLTSLMNNVGFEGQIFFTQDYNILNHMHWISIDTPQRDCISGLSPAQLPLRDNLDQNTKKELERFIQKMDYEYKEMLAKLRITSNISFIGKKI